MSSTPTGAAGESDLAYLEGILPESYRQPLRQLLIFTLARQVQHIADRKHELDQLSNAVTDNDAWASW
jgi:hypothetical protein